MDSFEKKPSLKNSVDNAIDTAPKVKKQNPPNINRHNWLIYKCYSMRDFKNALEACEETLKQFGPKHQYANMIKALIQRNQGLFNDSLSRLKSLFSFEPNDPEILKQISKNL